MKILFVTDKHCFNPYPCELSESILQQETSWYILMGLKEFWHSEIRFDIIHFHWIEELFGWDAPGSKDIEQLTDRIKFWKKCGAKIICTIHNIRPHLFPAEIGFECYSRIFELTDLFIHHGEVSKKLLKNEYNSAFDKYQIHAPIPHGLFTRYEKNVKRPDAREYLRLKPDDFMMLAFGRIRDFNENELILKSFRLLKDKKKKLFIPNYKFSERRPERYLQKAMLLINKNVYVRNSFVPEEIVPFYFISSDLVFIPRLNILNSGNLVLGFYYEKVVVGPDKGVVGEILKKTGNPVFTPGEDSSLAEAVNKGKQLALEGKGHYNYHYAKENWNWNLVSGLHIKYYKMVIKTK